ncbi:MAG: GNAT family N-acetyltransferase [Oscillospiraceae bacterium]|nr:GNAT family N-acetyltransferase [Oscillospiraceae bacterium]
MKIEYKKIDDVILNKLIDIYGEWVKQYIYIRDDTLPLAAMDGDFPAGYVCVTPRALDYPLENLQDAFIEVLGVHENCRRQGIGQHLIECCEKWARKAGFKQIRTHSNNQAVEAINMWHKLNYGLCPHDYYDDEPKKDDGRGYWVAKIL